MINPPRSCLTQVFESHFSLFLSPPARELRAQQSAWVPIGCAAEGVAGAVATWTPPTAWADARALLSAAAIYSREIVVINERDGVLEVISPEGSNDYMPWVVHFDKDHYSPVGIRSYDLLQRVLKTVPKAPWVHKQNTEGGGLSIERPFSDLVAEDKGADFMRPPPVLPVFSPNFGVQSWIQATRGWALGKVNRNEQIADRQEDETGINLVSINAGGWQTHGTTIMTTVQQPAIVCIQETLLTERATESARKAAKEQGWDMIASKGSQPKLSAGGKWKADRADHPGLLTLHTQSLDVNPVQCATQCGKVWQQKGRVQVLNVRRRDQPDLMIFNVYAHSGHTQTEQRQQFFYDLRQELLSHGQCQKIVVGDFNERLESSGLFGPLAAHGWRALHLITETGAPAQATYISGNQMSTPDGIMVSPDCELATPTALVTRLPGMGHCALSIPIQAQQHAPCLPVRHPTRLNPVPRVGPSPVDWDDAYRRYQDIRRQLWDDRETHQYHNPQQAVDSMWQDCQMLAQRQLVACATCDDDDIERVVRKYGQNDMNRQPPPNPRVVEKGGQEREDVQLRKAWNRLLSMARDEGTERCERKLRESTTFLCREMGLTVREFERDLRDPASALERWQERIRKACDNRREREATKLGGENCLRGMATPQLPCIGGSEECSKEDTLSARTLERSTGGHKPSLKLSGITGGLS